MKWIVPVFLLSLPQFATGQITFTRGSNAFELSGIIGSSLGYVKSGETVERFGFDLLDARLIFVGEHHPRFKYQVQMNIAELNSDFPTDYFLLDAFVNIDLPSQFEGYVGFQRLPISRNSNVSSLISVFTRRPPMSSGALFYRRGLGMVAHKKFADQKVNLLAGIFNANGALRSIDQLSTTFTYVARFDLAFPARVRYLEIDIRHTPVPLFGFGFNGMYSTQNEEVFFELFPLQVDGRKTLAIIDFQFFYRGFGLQAEVTQAWIDRRPEAGENLADEFWSRGMHVSGNYYFKKLRSILAARFEIFNPDDSVYESNFTAMTIGYNFLFDQSQDVVIRTDYRWFMDEPVTTTDFNNAEWRVSLQLRF